MMWLVEGGTPSLPVIARVEGYSKGNHIDLVESKNNSVVRYVPRRAADKEVINLGVGKDPAGGGKVVSFDMAKLPERVIVSAVADPAFPTVVYLPEKVCDNDDPEYFRCSVCGYEAQKTQMILLGRRGEPGIRRGPHEYRFCPNCGARVKGA